MANQITIASLLEEAIKNEKHELVIDGIGSSKEDYQLLAQKWTGTHVCLVEMKPTHHEAQELAKWKGRQINLHLCGHNDYDLATFLANMNAWQGHTLCIGYVGERIFQKIAVSDALHHPKYKCLLLKNCHLPKGFIDAIHQREPKLNISIVNEE